MSAEQDKRSDLRDIANAFKAQSKSLSKIEADTADSARAIEDISQTLMVLSGQLKPIQEAAGKIPDVLRAMATLTDGVNGLLDRLNKYVDATAEQNGGLRVRLTKLEQTVGQR